MSAQHGKHTEVLVADLDVTEFFNSANFNADVDTAETTTFRKDWKTHIEGTAGGTIELSGFYDTALTEDVEAFLGLGTPLVATVGPAGLKPGDLARLALVESTNYSESSPVGDAVSCAWSMLTTDRVEFGVSLKDIEVEITAAGNGTSFDRGASAPTASQTWTFHYHLLDLDATNVTIVVEDSANNTDWAPITGATSGALTVEGAGRVSGLGTVRRYIRVAYTPSGGATSALFGAAFAARP
jgi:hypothetical protein